MTCPIDESVADEPPDELGRKHHCQSDACGRRGDTAIKREKDSRPIVAHIFDGNPSQRDQHDGQQHEHRGRTGRIGDRRRGLFRSHVWNEEAR